MTKTPQQLLRAELANLHAYQVPNSEGFIKLDAMENPFSLPEGLRENWLQALSELELNRYPDPYAKELKVAFRNTFNISSSLDIMFGNGSDELIQLLVLATAKPDACVLTVTPSFSMYKLIAEFVGVKVIEVPLATDTFALQTDLVCEQIKKYNPELIFLACPNNPTGTLWPVEDVEKIIQTSIGLVIIDEAYSPFSAYSMMPIVEKYSHALMLRTISKLGLAGLRLGWLCGAEEWLNELNKLRLPYNINSLTQASAKFALENISVFNQQAAIICEQRAYLTSALNNVTGIIVYPSEANFILFKVLSGSAQDVFGNLIHHKVLIKNVSDKNLLQNCLRVTVGSEKENQAFLGALKSSLA